MKNHKILGSIVGAILGFLFVITCTSPLSSDSNKVTSGGKYQIATTTMYSSSNANYIFETTIDTETGDVIRRSKKSVSDYN